MKGGNDFWKKEKVISISKEMKTRAIEIRLALNVTISPLHTIQCKR